MFQTEPIIYLQSLGTQWFTFLMIMITTMGSSAFLVAIIVITIFGVDFKKGFLLFQLLLWTGLVTEILKILVAFPRPDFLQQNPKYYYYHQVYISQIFRTHLKKTHVVLYITVNMFYKLVRRFLVRKYTLIFPRLSFQQRIISFSP